MGDPSGIGPVIAVKALRKISGLAEFTVIGDSWLLKKAGLKNPAIPGLKVIDLENVDRKSFVPGKINAAYGRASLEYIDAALKLLKVKAVDCLVTCPISKEAVRKAGFRFPGHTEYLAYASRTKDFAMMVLNRKLRISLVTTHLALREVSSRINQEHIYRNIALTAASLKKYFRIPTPRIVVCGLNPHASDGGIIGKEERQIIEPAVRRARKSLGCNIAGPLPSDVAMYKACQGGYDAVVAMYHDQALISLKLTDFDSGVNMTLGLPFVRTSPLHGTAFDIAKRPALADPNSLIAAIKLAVQCASGPRRD